MSNKVHQFLLSLSPRERRHDWVSFDLIMTSQSNAQALTKALNNGKEHNFEVQMKRFYVKIALSTCRVTCPAVS